MQRLGRLDQPAFGWGNVGLVLLFLLILTVAGWLAPRLLGFSLTDSIAIEMELVVRTINPGALLKASIFPVVPGGTVSRAVWCFSPSCSTAQRSCLPRRC